jgi:ABC-2 type transport system permease protein
VVFCFDWLFACLAFYTTETWGLGMVRQSIGVFFSGALIPLALMPEWLRSVCQGLPFVQALYVPVSLLSGITPLSEAPRLWLGQLAWLAGLLVASRAVFRIAIRKVTVQGG